MRVVLLHSEAAGDATDAGALVRLLLSANHDVLNVGEPRSLDGLLAVAPEARCYQLREGASGADASIRAFGPEVVGCLGSGDWLESLGGAVAGARRVPPKGAEPSDHRARCEAVAGEVLGVRAVDQLRRSWDLAALQREAGSGREKTDEAVAAIDEACAGAVDRIAEGLERASELRELSKLISTLQHAMERQAADNADLQTQLEARGATIKERDEQVASLRSQVSAIGVQLDRMHRLGADLQDAHRVAGQLRERLEKLQSGDAVSIAKDELEDLRARAAQAQALGARVNEVGSELQRVHVIAGELRTSLSAREAEVAASRVQVEELREQVRNLHGLGSELHRIHGVAGDLKTQLEIRSARVAELSREVETLRTELETLRRDLRDADLRAATANAGAMVETGRAARIAEELARVQQAVIQAQARAETLRNDLSRARADRDALDALVSARDAEIVQVRGELAAAAKARRDDAAARDRAMAQAAELRREAATLRQRVSELLASRWRKLGQRMGIAMSLPWEEELREVKPGAVGPRAPSQPERTGKA